MARTREEANAYQRGYHRGAAGKWPQLDTIPDVSYAKLAQAASDLSDAADALLAGFIDRGEDPAQIAVDAARDRVRDCIQFEWERASRAATEERG